MGRIRPLAVLAGAVAVYASFLLSTVPFVAVNWLWFGTVSIGPSASLVYRIVYAVLRITVSVALGYFAQTLLGRWLHSQETLAAVLLFCFATALLILSVMPTRPVRSVGDLVLTFATPALGAYLRFVRDTRTGAAEQAHAADGVS